VRSLIAEFFTQIEDAAEERDAFREATYAIRNRIKTRFDPTFVTAFELEYGL
jgi:hypothetical protein|tara:strand:+ start:896 stop:1051 length:156 start_codon:yes stop_codon:yes gene_type:complete